MHSSLLAPALEIAINRGLALDSRSHGQAQAQLKTLQGHLICLQLTQPTITLYFMPTANKLQISHFYDANPDVTIHSSVISLLRMMRADDAGQALLAEGVKLAGDSHLGQRFSQILRSIDIDWEELLATIIGDRLAYQAGKRGRKLQHWLQESTYAMQLNLQEYLQEEGRFTPSSAELTPYLDAVDQIRFAAERLEARIQRLELAQTPLTTQKP